MVKLIGTTVGLLLASGLAAGCNDSATTSRDYPAPPPTVSGNVDRSGGYNHNDDGISPNRFDPKPAQGPYYPGQ